MRKPNLLPAANSRRAFRLRRLGEIRCSIELSDLGSPAAVAECIRWPMRIITMIACVFALLLSGCFLPIGSKVSDGYRPSGETLAFLRLPGATQSDVVENLGHPLYKSEATETFVYVWQEMPRYVFVRPNRLLSDSPVTRASVEYGSAEVWALLVAFDAGGHVLDYDESYIDTRSLEAECADFYRARTK